MADTTTTNGNVLLHSEPSAPTSAQGVLRTDALATVPLAQVSMFGAGVSTLEGVVAISTMNSGLTNGPLIERMRVHTNGNVGIGTATPTQALEVTGTVRATAFEGNGAALAGVNDTTKVAKSGDAMNGPLMVQGRLQVIGQAITPSVGNSDTAGLMFPRDVGGGAGDAGWVRYFARAGESMTLQIGIANDADDHISLQPSGNVGIGTLTPVNKLDVSGDVAILGKHALRGNDSWLRLNQDGAFVSGVHTPGVFAPNSLNVGGVNGWGNPGAGNLWVAGASTMYGNLETKGSITAANSDIYFSNTTHWHTGTGNTLGWAAIENASNFGALMILGRQTSAGRIVKLWDRLEVNGRLHVYDSWAVVNGAGSEQAYLGGDGAGRDVQIGSLSAGVQSIAAYNATTNRYMSMFALDFHATSDLRRKQDVQDISGALEKVLRLRAVSFRWKEETPAGRQLGLVAQEVKDVLPEIVHEDRSHHLTLSYNSITALLVEAVKEQASQIAKLEQRLAALEGAR